MNTYLVTVDYGHGDTAQYKQETISAQDAVNQVRKDAAWPLEIISVHLLVDMEREWK